MKTGNRPTTLADSNTFFNLQKGTKENNTQPLSKNESTTATKTTWVLPLCDQHGVYEALSRRCRHGRKSKVFASRTIVCLFVCCCCLGHVQATSGSPVVRSQALQLSVCTTGLCVAPRTHVTGGRLENPPFYLQSTPKETDITIVYSRYLVLM